MRRGFTIIELVVVMVILAILAGAASLSIGKKLQPSRFEDVVDRVMTFDRITRIHARRFGKETEMVFQLRNGKIFRREDGKRRSEDLRVTLPRGFRADRIIMSDGQERTTNVSFACSPQGRTPSYAIRLLGPRDEDNTWLVVAGLSGDVTQVKDEKQVRAIFRRLHPSRNDLD